MKNNYKPFRFLTTQELNYFINFFTEKIHVFNQDFFTKNFNISIHSLLSEIKSDELLLIKNEHPIALIEGNYLEVLKQGIFSDTSSCFNPICEELFTQLMTHFFNATSLELVMNTLPSKEWFYPGSAAINLVLSNEKGQFSLCLHPNWVLAELPPRPQGRQPLKSIETALASEKVSFSIQLEPQHLRLETLACLKRGMLIKTDHPFVKSLLMHHEKEAICQVELGQTHHSKSIRLKRTL